MKSVLKFSIISFIGLLIINSNSYSTGKTAVITLVFPSGAINTGMGECGVSLSDNIYSTFANPASLPAIGDNNMSQLVYSSFREDLLPAFNIPDLYHETQYSGIFINNIFRQFDFGYANGNNFINFGTNSWTDELGEVIGSARSYEKVSSNSFSLRGYKIASVGINYKAFTSALAPGFGPNNEGIAKGSVFDLGFRLEYEYELWKCVKVHPALGFSILNYGQSSVYYISPEESDPLPRTRLYGGSINIDFVNLIGITGVREREFAVVDEDKIEHMGIKIDITPFYSILGGQLIDPNGERNQGMKGYALTLT